MGFFSWKTSDTKKSISNHYSTEPTFPVYMRTEDGRCWVEKNYDGYGLFGGKDIYELIAELNGKTHREDGINLVFQASKRGEFEDAANAGIKVPKLFEHENSQFENYPYPENCRYQGFFYPMNDENDTEEEGE